jgi:hypothetical protein
LDFNLIVYKFYGIAHEHGDMKANKKQSNLIEFKQRHQHRASLKRWDANESGLDGETGDARRNV